MKPNRATRSQANSRAGATRRNKSAAHNDKFPHLGKLGAIAAIVVGVVFWTTSSSESLTPTSTPDNPNASLNKSFSESLASISGISIAEVPEIPEKKGPDFFFDDSTDALERSYTQDQPTLNTDKKRNLTHTEQPIGTTKKATDALLAMAAIPSALDPTFAQTPSTSAAKENSLPKEFSQADENKVTPPQTTGSLSVTVAAGDTFSGILNDNGLSAEDMHELLANDTVKTHLSSIDVGQIFNIKQNEQGQLTSLTTKAGDDIRINIDQSDLGFEVSATELPIEKRQHVTSGEIELSLYLTAEQAHLKQSTIMELANIFQWELDFARDIRKGDKFSLVFEKLYREGEYIGDGDILAAEFVRGGKSYKAIYLTKEDGSSGYYSPQGESKRRAFMRHPVDVVRITSKFNPKRMHPILRQPRAHRGVDYGSPYGSPIYATADGTVIHAGEKSAYGETVILKHAHKFSTLYAHMSKVSNKSIVGKRVSQGDVIGYVGNTGRVTGTHLHYEFRVNGEQIDPLKVDLPTAEPLEKKYHAKLADLTQRYGQKMAKSLEELEYALFNKGYNEEAEESESGTEVTLMMKKQD